MPSQNPPQPNIAGLHSVRAALLNPNRRVISLLLSPNAADSLGNLVQNAQNVHVLPPKILSKNAPPDFAHQGALAVAQPLTIPSLSALAASANLLVALDHPQDPQNLGAALRVASVFGADALVIPKRRSAPLSLAVSKIASGALESVPVAFAPNFSQTLNQFRSAGMLAVGLHQHSNSTLSSIPPQQRIVLAVGAEHRGLRPLSQASCDALASIPAPGDDASNNPLTLNLSAALAVALYHFTSSPLSSTPRRRSSVG